MFSSSKQQHPSTSQPPKHCQRSPHIRNRSPKHRKNTQLFLSYGSYTTWLKKRCLSYLHGSSVHVPRRKNTSIRLQHASNIHVLPSRCFETSGLIKILTTCQCHPSTTTPVQPSHRHTCRPRRGSSSQNEKSPRTESLGVRRGW